jgi:hypothetical protein
VAFLVVGLLLSAWLFSRSGSATGKGDAEVPEETREQALLAKVRSEQLTEEERDAIALDQVNEREPKMRVLVVEQPSPTTDLILALKVTQPDDLEQKLSRLTLWLNDSRYDKPPQINKSGTVDEPRVVIPRGELRNGTNLIMVQGYDARGRMNAQKKVSVEYRPSLTMKPDLYGLCVGINDYKGVKGLRFPSLNFARPDALALAEALKRQKNNALYRSVEVDQVAEKEATAAEIRARLVKLGRKVKPDDWFVLFLSGQGHAKESDKGYVPGSFFYVCADSKVDTPESFLTGQELCNVLAGIRCRKLIFLDASRSGDVASTLNHDAVPLLVFSSCKRSEESLEPKPKYGKHGLFAQCLLEALGERFQVADANKDGTLDLRELVIYVKKRMLELLDSLDTDYDEQTPVFSPSRPPPLPFARAPRPKR